MFLYSNKRAIGSLVFGYGCNGLIKSLKEKGDKRFNCLAGSLFPKSYDFKRHYRHSLIPYQDIKTVYKDNFCERKTEPFEGGPTENQSCLTNQAINKMCG